VKTETLSTIEDVRESAHAWAKYLIYPRNECYLSGSPICNKIKLN